MGITMKNLTYFLDQPGGSFTATTELIPEPGPGEIRLRTLKTSVCQSDVVIHQQGLPRIKQWPAILFHEACCVVDAVGSGVEEYVPGDLVGLGCDIPCGDLSCIYCGTMVLETGLAVRILRRQAMSFRALHVCILFFPIGLLNWGPLLSFLKILIQVTLANWNR